MTLHSGTDIACTIDTAINETIEAFTGQILGQNCYSTPTADAGCAFADTDSRSFGYGFNGAEGGVFALLWDQSVGMSIYHFARSDIPADITNKQPTPATWGTPAGFWSAQTCDISKNFYEHQLVIDTTICGNWAGAAYGNSGCPGTCSSMVANATNFVGESRSFALLGPCLMVPLQMPNGLSIMSPSINKQSPPALSSLNSFYQS